MKEAEVKQGLPRLGLGPTRRGHTLAAGWCVGASEVSTGTATQPRVGSAAPCLPPPKVLLP